MTVAAPPSPTRLVIEFDADLAPANPAARLLLQFAREADAVGGHAVTDEVMRTVEAAQQANDLARRLRPRSHGRDASEVIAALTVASRYRATLADRLRCR